MIEPPRRALSTRAQIPPFYAMQIAGEALRRIAAGQDMVRFDVGQPAGGAPSLALEAASRAMRSDPLGYTDSLGAPALRAAIADLYERRYGVAVDPTRVVVTTGGSGAFGLAYPAIFDTGDVVAMAAPGYPPYRHILTSLGLGALAMAAEARDRFQPTRAWLDALPKDAGLKGLVIAGPANPTGASLPARQLEEICRWCKEHGVWLISDEIYHGLEFGEPTQTALAYDPDAIIINSFSKYWAMTGWRIGWLVLPERLVSAVERLAQNISICPPAISQAAALGALRAEEECLARKEGYARNRALLLRELPGLGLPPVIEPDGAFYMLIDHSRLDEDGARFARRCLEAGVALTPGLDFDVERGGQWARVSFPTSFDRVERGLERLAKLRA